MSFGISVSWLRTLRPALSACPIRYSPLFLLRSAVSSPPLPLSSLLSDRVLIGSHSTPPPRLSLFAHASPFGSSSLHLASTAHLSHHPLIHPWPTPPANDSAAVWLQHASTSRPRIEFMPKHHCSRSDSTLCTIIDSISINSQTCKLKLNSHNRAHRSAVAGYSSTRAARDEN